MKVEFEKLHLFTNDSQETIISFSQRLTFIYGNMGVGKSTVLNLLFYCMGGKIIYTPAIKHCLCAVQLDVRFGDNFYSLYRRLGATYIIVEDIKEQKKFSVSENNFSRFIHECCGLPVRYAVLGGNEEKEVTLSFKNYNWFSYLNQLEMDGVFFNLNNDSFKKNSAKNALLVLLDNKLFVDKEKSQVQRTLKKRVRQYEEGKEVFKYLNGMWDQFSDMLLMDDEDEKRCIEEIERICEKENVKDKEIKRLLGLQEKIDYYRIRKQYELRKKVYWIKAQNLESEYMDMENAIIDVWADSEGIAREMYIMFLDCLRNINFPGITEMDEVKIDRRTFLPIIYNQFTGKEVSFNNLGSGGKRSLFKICFALAMHRYHAKTGYSSYLPSFFILDTPMKNISEREDKILYDKFYQYIFQLFSNELSDVQLIIVEKELRDLSCYTYKDEAIVKHMTNNDLLNPPLFKNYKGY